MTPLPNPYGTHRVVLEDNVTDDVLEDAGVDLEYLARLRAHAAGIGERILTRQTIMDDGSVRYLFGLTCAGDWPFWRGSLEDLADKVTEREAGR